MAKVILIFFTLMTLGSLYSTYQGIGLQEVISQEPAPKRVHSTTVRSSSHYSSGGWSYGK